MVRSQSGLEDVIEETSEGLLITIHVKPSSKKTLLTHEYGELVFYTREPPVKGKANRSLIKYLAKTLGAPQSAILIVRGEKSRDKVVLVRGLSKEEVVRRLVR